MFRAGAVGPYDEGIAKATDENLTSEDWGAIMELCDRVSTDTNGPKEAVQSMIKRLAHRNANVQLYTLELANALSQNCGKNIHRELSSRAFTDALLKLANDRNTHTQVKAKILERMKEWSDMFKNDSDLGIMYDAYYRVKQSNPTLQPPSAPQKNSLTQLDRQKEEEELQMALKLSLQEEERKKQAPAAAQASASSSGRAPETTQQQQPQQQQQTHVPVSSSGTTAATVSRVRALFDFTPSEAGELEFKKGDVIAVLESVYKDWWRGSLKGQTGIFPLNYVEKLTDPTPEELQREAQMEAEVFAEIKNVEKLLTLLSASNTAPREEDNEEIAKLYHQTTQIRPKLIKLIEKYSQKKDDFTQLNEKFIKARRDYEALLESSMAQPPQPAYHQYAMRPQSMQPSYPPPGPSYPQQGLPQQDPQRFYTPGPQDHSSPPPNNFQRPGTAAPFYVAGTEIPAAASSRPSAPSVSQPYSQHPGGGPPSPRLQNKQQPPPINTSSPPVQTNNPYSPYTQQQQQDQRRQSTYGAQELATSVYDSPIAPHTLHSAATYSSSVYSPDEAPQGAQSFAPSAPPAQPSQPQYQSYQPPRNPSYDGSSVVPGAPPVPTGAAPPVPHGVSAGRPPATFSPPPLQPSGLAYDARQNLPSATSQPQYKPYVPPSSSEPSAPGPADYYRQSSGNVY